MSEETSNGWVKLYHPTGALVTIPLQGETPINPGVALSYFSSVDILVQAGFSVNAPGLEEGELSEEVSAVALRTSGDDTPIIDFYSANTRLSKKFMHVYLNGPEDVAAFEAATGVKLHSLVTYDGKVAIERTDKNAPKYIKAITPIKLVWKLSPKWESWKAEGGEGQEPHKRLLVRYETSSGKSPAPAGEQVFKKLDPTFVQKIADHMALKPAFVAKRMAQHAPDTLTFTQACQIIEAALADPIPEA